MLIFIGKTEHVVMGSKKVTFYTHDGQGLETLVLFDLNKVYNLKN